MNGEKLKNLRIFYIILLLYGFLHVAPMPVDAQELRFQIVIGGKQAVKKACQSSNYSKYHVVNGTSCAEFKPKKKKINQSVLDLQRLLTELGYNPGPADGLAGKKTRNAAQKAFEDRGLSFSGRLDAASLKALRDADAKQATNLSEDDWFTNGQSIQSCLRDGCITFYCKNANFLANFRVSKKASEAKGVLLDAYRFYFDDFELGNGHLEMDSAGILNYELERILSADYLEIVHQSDSSIKRKFDFQPVKNVLTSLYNKCQNDGDLEIPANDDVQYVPYEETHDYVDRLRELALVDRTSVYDQCTIDQQRAKEIFRNFHVNWSDSKNVSIEDNVELKWGGIGSQTSVPVWLVLSSNEYVRYFGKGMALSKDAVAPFGLNVGEGQQRFIIPLNAVGQETSGSLKIDFLRNGAISLELSAVAYLPSCFSDNERVYYSETKQFDITSDFPKISASTTVAHDKFLKVYADPELKREIAYDGETFLIKSLGQNAVLNQIGGSRLNISPTGRFAVIGNFSSGVIIDLIDGKVTNSLTHSGSLIWGWKDTILLSTSYPSAATSIRFPLSDWEYDITQLGHKLQSSLHSSKTNIYLDIHNALLEIEAKPRTGLLYSYGETLSLYDGSNSYSKASDVNKIIPHAIPDGINIPQGFYPGMDVDLSKVDGSSDMTVTEIKSHSSLSEQLLRLGLKLRDSEIVKPTYFATAGSAEYMQLEKIFQRAGWSIDFTKLRPEDETPWACERYHQKNAIEKEYVEDVYKFSGQLQSTILILTHCEGMAFDGMLQMDYFLFDLSTQQPNDIHEAVILSTNQANGIATEFPMGNLIVSQSGEYLLFTNISTGAVGVYHFPTKKIKIYELENFADTLVAAYLSDNSEFLVTEHSDGIFQIYKIDLSSFEKSIGSLSVIQPTRVEYTGRVIQGEIVVWNKYGYFDATADAASLIDVIFEGTDLQFSLDQFSDLLYVQNLIKTDISEIEKQRVKIPFPPQIKGHIYSIDSKAKASFEFPRVENLDVLEVYQDGVLTQNEELEPGANKWTGQFNLLPGVQTVAAVVKSTEGLSSRPLTFSLGKRETLPVVKSLAVAVDRYSDPALTDLNYAKADAARILSSLKTISGEHIELIDNQFIGGRRATPDKVYDAVDQLVQEAAPHEHLVLFMAGHGLQSEDGDFYLALHSTDAKEIADTAVSFSRLFEALSTTSAKVTVLIDACHSGDAGTGIFATTDGALQNLGNIPSNVTILAAAKGRQESIESEELQGGYFSVAFEDVISNSRPRYDVNNNERIEATELQAGLYDFVTEKTNGKQTPWMTKGRIIGDFSLF